MDLELHDLEGALSGCTSSQDRKRAPGRSEQRIPCPLPCNRDVKRAEWHEYGPTCQQRIPLPLPYNLDVMRAELHKYTPGTAKTVGDLAQKDVQVTAETRFLSRAEGHVAMGPRSQKAGMELVAEMKAPMALHLLV